MRSSAPWLAALAALGGPVRATAPASATPVWAPAGVAAGELISPAPSTRLAGGSTAILEWTTLPGWERLAAREEWEAFLSLDGGRSYAVRITPHLDRDLRRIQWAVPDLPSGDVRLLLRFGDERRDTVVELPQRFAIVAGALGPASPDALSRVSGKRGEAARPREAGGVGP